jgi:transcriptional regulator with XRE-family HTH domain
MTEHPSRRGWRSAEVAGAREARALAATLGGQVRAGRRARGWSQAQLGHRVGLSQAWISRIERAFGVGVPLGVWIALGVALGRPIAISLSTPPIAEPADAGHLPGQELTLALARRNGRPRSVELPTRPANPSRMIDVAIRDDGQRVLILQEISNRIDDLGQTIRDHRHKVVEAAAVAAVIGGDDGPYRVAFCWIVRATAANRALVGRYPNLIADTFPGSSRAWVRALADGGPVPRDPGLVWIDLAGTRLIEHRAGQPSRRTVVA